MFEINIFVIGMKCISWPASTKAVNSSLEFFKIFITGYRINIIDFVSCNWGVMKWFFEDGVGIKKIRDRVRSATAGPV